MIDFIVTESLMLTIWHLSNKTRYVSQILRGNSLSTQPPPVSH